MSRRKRHPKQNGVAGAIAARPPHDRFIAIGVFALLVVAVFIAYAPALNGAQLWDDDAHITKPELQSPEGLRRIWFDVGATQQYYPLLHTAFWIEHQLWGDAPLNYHLLNLWLHAGDAFLVYLILRKLQIPGALLAAAIFALHPVMVESVAWITEQKNTLSAAFYLSALWVYLHFDQNRQRSLYTIALALFIAGLLCKTVTATLPAALLVIFWWQRGRLSWQRDARPLAPFFVLGAVAGLFTAWVERTLIGAEGASFDLSLAQRALLAGRVIWFYLAKLLWPFNLVFIYPRWHLDSQVWWQWLFPAGALLLLFALWLVRRRWRAPLAGWLFFVGTLFPVLGFFNVYPFVFSFVADHFQYLASLGIIVLAAAGLTLTFARLPSHQRPLGPILCIVLVGSLAVLTYRQAAMYGDAATLYQSTIDRNLDCWMAYNNLGILLLNSGKSQESIPYFEHALQLKHDYLDARNNFGLAQFRLGNAPAALEQFQQVIKLKPTYVMAWANMALAYAAMAQPAEAVAKAQKAIELARSQKQTKLAGEIETWLTNYRAQIGPRNDSSAPAPTQTPP